MTLPNRAREARDQGIARVSDSNAAWLERALRALPLMRWHHPEATGEMMRYWLRRTGFPEPTKPHAWGALIRTALKRELIEDTGRSMQMSAERSHARRTPIWRFR